MLCSMLGGGQLRRRGRFHILTEIGGPLGPGGGAAGRGGVGKPPSSRQAEVLPQDPMMESDRSEVRMWRGPRLPSSGSQHHGSRDGSRGLPGMSRGPGDPESWGAGGRPASGRLRPGGSSQATWKTVKGLVGRPRASPLLPGADGGAARRAPQRDESQPQALRARPWGFLERKSTRWTLKSHSPRRPQLERGGGCGWRMGAPRDPLEVGASAGLPGWETDSNLSRDPGVVTSSPWASVSPPVKAGHHAPCPPGAKSPGPRQGTSACCRLLCPQTCPWSQGPGPHPLSASSPALPPSSPAHPGRVPGQHSKDAWCRYLCKL